VIKRFILHFEWHRHYRRLPRIRIEPVIRHGQRGTDGGQEGTFVNCEECSGAGTLFMPDLEFQPNETPEGSTPLSVYDDKVSPPTIRLDMELSTQYYKVGSKLWTRRAEYIVTEFEFGRHMVLTRKDVYEAEQRRER
jgi:hypothetical protein